MSAISIADMQPKNLVISCGKGRVSISLETGMVTFEDCTPDEAAKSFWDAVERMGIRFVAANEAAPDMLAAATALLNSSDYSDDVRPLMNALRAAIAKATS